MKDKSERFPTDSLGRSFYRRPRGSWTKSVIWSPVKLFDGWIVTKHGLESTFQQYCLDKDRLWEPDWTIHIERKGSLYFGEFKEALAWAQKFHISHKPKTVR